MNRHDALHDLAVPYVLDALDDDERAAFGAHLAECETCRFEVAELEEAMAAIATSDAVVPPASLRTNVLDAIAGVPQEDAPIAHDGGDGPGGGALQGTAGPPAVAPVIPLRRRTVTMITAAAVAAVLLLVVAVAVFVDRPDRLERITEAGDATTVTVPATDAFPGGDPQASLVFSAGEEGAVLTVGALGAAGEGTTYQAWVISPGATEPVPAGTFAPDEAGAVAAVLDAPVAAGDTIAVTVEPEGGSPAPTTEPILAAVVPG